MGHHGGAHSVTLMQEASSCHQPQQRATAPVACALHSSIAVQHRNAAPTCRLHAAAMLSRRMATPAWPRRRGRAVVHVSCMLRPKLTLNLLLPAGGTGAEDQDARHGRLHQAHHLEKGHRVGRHQLVQVLPRRVAHRGPEVSPVCAVCFPLFNLTAALFTRSGSPLPRKRVPLFTPISRLWQRGKAHCLSTA